MSIKPIQLNRAINLANFNAIGTFSNSVAINLCSSIPDDLKSNSVGDWILTCIANNNTASIRTQVLLIPQGNQYSRYERTITNPYGGYNWGGGDVYTHPWHKIFFIGDTYGANFIPDTTNSRNLGSSSTTWANIYSQNAVTVVSDRNAKSSIQDIDDTVLQAWSEVKPKQYKLNGDDNWSFGYVAQDIVDSFTKHGLNYKEYNIVHEEDGKFMLKYDMCHVLNDALLASKLK